MKTSTILLLFAGVGALALFGTSIWLAKPTTSPTDPANVPATPATSSSLGNVSNALIVGVGGVTPLVLAADIANTSQSAPTNP
jgi:hypothetical protein